MYNNSSARYYLLKKAVKGYKKKTRERYLCKEEKEKKLQYGCKQKYRKKYYKIPKSFMQ